MRAMTHAYSHIHTRLSTCPPTPTHPHKPAAFPPNTQIHTRTHTHAHTLTHTHAHTHPHPHKPAAFPPNTQIHTHTHAHTLTHTHTPATTNNEDARPPCGLLPSQAADVPETIFGTELQRQTAQASKPQRCLPFSRLLLLLLLLLMMI